MLFRFVGFLLVSQLLTRGDHNPVPNPGTTRFLSPMSHHRGREGEGCVLSSTENTEASPWIDAFLRDCDAKPGGFRPKQSQIGITWPDQSSKVVKRSLIRAHNRALRYGAAWYRGRLMTPDAFPPGMPQNLAAYSPYSSTRSKCNLQTQSRRTSPARALQYLNWNVGGLSIGKLDEVLEWMTLHDIQVGVLTETRWTYSNEWTSNGWSFLRSGYHGGRNAGVLCIVSTKACPSNAIRWCEHIPGRLIHIQLRLPQRPLDLVLCYQHVYNSNRDCLPKRRTFWNKLTDVLQQLPQRQILALVGDFNCNFPCNGFTGRVLILS